MRPLDIGPLEIGLVGNRKGVETDGSQLEWR